MLGRKHFRLPSSWKGKTITLGVGGALASSSWWVNGKQMVVMKTDGYLPTTLRLDNVAGLVLNYGTAEHNVIAVWTDNSASTGWWYEGSGAVHSYMNHAYS